MDLQSRKQIELMIEQKKIRQQSVAEKRMLRAQESMRRKKGHEEILGYCTDETDENIRRTDDSEIGMGRQTVAESSYTSEKIERVDKTEKSDDDDDEENDFASRTVPYRPNTSLDSHISPFSSFINTRNSVSPTKPSYFNFKLFWKVLKSEFRVSNLDFNSTTSMSSVNWIQDFGVPVNHFFFNKWKRFLLLRILMTVFIGLIWAVSVLDYVFQGILPYWFIFFTHWTLTIELIYFIFATYTTFKSRNWIRDYGQITSQKMPRYVSIMWFLRSISFPGIVIVVVLYWTLGFTTFDEIKLATHGLDLIPVLIDSFYNPISSPLLHGVYLLLYCDLYSLFTWVYYRLGGTDQFGNHYIYAKLDWSNPDITGKMFFFAIVIGIPIFNIVYWWISFVRRQRALWYINHSQSHAATTKAKSIKKGHSQTIPKTEAEFFPEKE